MTATATPLEIVAGFLADGIDELVDVLVEFLLAVTEPARDVLGGLVGIALIVAQPRPYRPDLPWWRP